MLTALHTSEAVANHILNIMSEYLYVSQENIKSLIFYKRGKKLKNLFWALLEDEYPNHQFKKMKYCDECGLIYLE